MQLWIRSYRRVMFDGKSNAELTGGVDELRGLQSFDAVDVDQTTNRHAIVFRIADDDAGFQQQRHLWVAYLVLLTVGEANLKRLKWPSIKQFL